MITLPRRRWVVAAVGAGAAVAAAVPDLQYLRRLQETSQELRDQLRPEIQDGDRQESKAR
jgi:hypothetical protein